MTNMELLYRPKANPDADIQKTLAEDAKRRDEQREQEEAAKAATAEPSLSELATRIKAGHSAVIEAKKNIVCKAIEVGGWLNQAKAKMEHGQWLPWLKANCPEISERTAQRYMHLADNKEQLEHVMKSATVADLTLAAALDFLNPGPEAEELETDTDDDQDGDQDDDDETVSEDDEPDQETSVNASEEYDKAEEKLIKKLQNLMPDEAEAAIADTIKKLRETVATMKKAAAAVEKKAA